MVTTETRPSFRDQLQHQWNQGKFLCVGLDPDYSKIPQFLKDRYSERGDVLEEFVNSIVDATADIAGFYKPNLAFYEGFWDGDRDENEGSGEERLGYIIDRIHGRNPEISVIGDGKRADIGATNKYYDKMFNRYGFDAMTTSPYLGGDTFPSLQATHPDRGLIVLCRTTNPGSKEIQDLPINIYEAYQNDKISYNEFNLLHEILLKSRKSATTSSISLYEMIAFKAAHVWANRNMGLVMGATSPEAFKPVRDLAGDMPFLIPGIGTQGGNLETSLKYAPDSRNQGIIINNGSAIIHASSGEDFAEAARKEALAYDKKIREGLGIA